MLSDGRFPSMTGFVPPTGCLSRFECPGCVSAIAHQSKGHSYRLRGHCFSKNDFATAGTATPVVENGKTEVQ